MARKKFKKVNGMLFRPIPSSPALFGKVGSDLSKPKNRLSNLQIEGLRERLKKKRK